jgi:hypothetical protein
MTLHKMFVDDVFKNRFNEDPKRRNPLQIEVLWIVMQCVSIFTYWNFEEFVLPSLS